MAISVQQVRDISGAPSDLIDDATITNLIAEVLSKTEGYFGVRITPATKIETITGEWKDRIMLDEYFPLKIIKMQNGDDVLDLTDIFCRTEEGFAEFVGETTTSSFFQGYGTTFSGFDLDVRCKYLFGAIERDFDTQTDVTVAVTAGSSVAVTVTSSTGFNVNDYVFIEDLNQKYEVAKITAVPDGTTITLDVLNNDFTTDAMITQSKTMAIFDQYMLYETAIAVANYAVGNTYTVATSYTVPEFTITKGVPYPHWTQSFTNNQKKRDEILARIKSLLGTLV